MKHPEPASEGSERGGSGTPQAGARGLALYRVQTPPTMFSLLKDHMAVSILGEAAKSVVGRSGALDRPGGFSLRPAASLLCVLGQKASPA